MLTAGLALEYWSPVSDTAVNHVCVGLLQWRPHCRPGPATLPHLWEPAPSHPPFYDGDLETRGFCVFMCFLMSLDRYCS